MIIGEKYLDRFGEIMTVVDRIHEDTQALPFAIFVETEDEIMISNITSHVTPTLVRGNILQSSSFPLDRPGQESLQIQILQFRFIFRNEEAVLSK